MVRHDNTGRCPKCASFFDKYPGFNQSLRTWFEAFQVSHPEAHISCAGRGKADQEKAFATKASRAHFGQSSHNFNCAIDIFVISAKFGKDNYPTIWYKTVLAPAIQPWLDWYGAPGSAFFEEGHVEVRSWRDLKTQGIAKLVEEENGSKTA